MDKSAIEQIQQSATQECLVRHLKSNLTHDPVIIAPDNFKLRSLEPYMKNRSGYRFTFKTESINDFIQYGIDFDQVGASCFVDSSHMVAKTVFDLGTLEEPLHQEHTAFLSLEKTAAFSKLLSMNGAKLSQRQASDFIEDWDDSIVIRSTSGEYMGALKDWR